MFFNSLRITAPQLRKALETFIHTTNLSGGRAADLSRHLPFFRPHELMVPFYSTDVHARRITAHSWKDERPLHFLSSTRLVAIASCQSSLSTAIDRRSGGLYQDRLVVVPYSLFQTNHPSKEQLSFFSTKGSGYPQSERIDELIEQLKKLNASLEVRLKSLEAKRTEINALSAIANGVGSKAILLISLQLKDILEVLQNPESIEIWKKSRTRKNLLVLLGLGLGILSLGVLGHLYHVWLRREPTFDPIQFKSELTELYKKNRTWVLGKQRELFPPIEGVYTDLVFSTDPKEKKNYDIFDTVAAGGAVDSQRCSDTRQVFQSSNLCFHRTAFPSK